MVSKSQIITKSQCSTNFKDTDSGVVDIFHMVTLIMFVAGSTIYSMEPLQLPASLRAATSVEVQSPFLSSYPRVTKHPFFNIKILLMIKLCWDLKKLINEKNNAHTLVYNAVFFVFIVQHIFTPVSEAFFYKFC
jgi:hypothetical protein